MRGRSLGQPGKAYIRAPNGQNLFRLCLMFPERSPAESVEFEISLEAMTLLAREMARLSKPHTPANHPSRGRPKLHIVPVPSRDYQS